MERSAFKTKLRGMGESHPPRVLDLFAGCGGLSLGFSRAGFVPLAAVEIDALAIGSYARNFHGGEPEKVLAAHSCPRDIVRAEPANLLADLGMSGEDVELAVDVIIGGPPCQAFARVGRAKLREIDEHPEAYLQDPRANLYLRFLSYVRQLKPLAILMENVPDLLNYGGHNVAEETCEVLTDFGYRCAYTLLNSVFYGVPQMRERAFILAYAEEVGPLRSFRSPLIGSNSHVGMREQGRSHSKRYCTIFSSAAPTTARLQIQHANAHNRRSLLSKR